MVSYSDLQRNLRNTPAGLFPLALPVEKQSHSPEKNISQIRAREKAMEDMGSDSR